MITNTMDLVVMAEWNRQYRADMIAKLDAQGRHRSEWCYAPYDERKISPPKNGAPDVEEG